MTKVPDKEMTGIMKSDLKLHGPLEDIPLEIVDKEIDINGPTVGVKVKPVEKDVAEKLASIGVNPKKEKEQKKDGAVLSKEKQAKMDLNPTAQTGKPSGDRDRGVSFGPSVKKALSQKELKWRKKIEKMLTEIMATKDMVKPVHAENLPQKIKERLIKDAAVRGDANTPIGATRDSQTSKKAGWTHNPWSASLKKAFERWAEFLEGPGIRSGS